VVVRLKPLDVAFMRAIHQKVNVVPVIAKADTLTKVELSRLKHTVRTSLGLRRRRLCLPVMVSYHINTKSVFTLSIEPSDL